MAQPEANVAELSVDTKRHGERERISPPYGWDIGERLAAHGATCSQIARALRRTPKAVWDWADRNGLKLYRAPGGRPPGEGRDPLKGAFLTQRQRAAMRGIGWELTFEQWLVVWQESGRLEQRGQGRGRYCMARRDDVGPYAVGNVFIQTHEANTAEGNRTRHQARGL